MPDETRGRLDREIDRAVRSMMHVDPAPGLRTRVAERIARDAAGGPIRAARPFWLTPAFAATLVVVTLVPAFVLFRPAPEDTPAARQIASGSASADTVRDDIVLPSEGTPAQPEGPRETAPAGASSTVDSIFGTPTQMVSAANLPGSAGSTSQGQTGAKAAPAAPDQTVNIKLNLTISDQIGTGDPVKKTLSMIVADGQTGTIRNTGNVKDQGRVQIRVEVRPKLLPSGQIRLALALEYAPIAAGTGTPVQDSALSQQISALIEPGKPVVVTQSADPASDRRIVVEVQAAVLK
jgi:hypothetical protein